MPTAFLPDEDQGYLIVSAQLPDGASKERTDAVMQQISKIAKTIPGVDHVVTVSGVSILDNMAHLANAGVAFVVLDDWDARRKQKGQDLRSIYQNLNRSLQGVTQAVAFALLPPPIQGIGNVSGFSMQVEIKNGDFDYALLQSLADAVIRDGSAQSALQRLGTTFRAGAPQLSVTVNRIKAETLGITVGNVFSALAGYVGSTYAAQFNKFGHVFQVYTQALPDYRASVDDIENLKVKAGNGTMTPIGTVVDIKEVQGPPLISLYNLYPSATVVGSAAPGFSSGQALDIMDQIGAQALPNGTGYEWTAMSYQEKAVGSQIYFVFGLAVLLVYFVLAGQYESWILPLVRDPLRAARPDRNGRRADRSRRRQQSLHADRPHPSDRARQQERDPGRGICAPKTGRGDGDRRCGGRRSAAQVPAHSHDLLRLHSGRLSARHCDRRGRRRAPVDRHRGLQRHDRLDLPRRSYSCPRSMW